MRNSYVAVLGYLAVAVMVTSPLGCGGGTSNSSSSLPRPVPSPTVTIAISPATITVGQSATLTWSSANSASCAALASDLVYRLKAWKQVSEFSGVEDWIFASPVKVGRLPYSYTGVWRELDRAAKVAEIGHLGTHAFRHTHRTWLDLVGTPIATQQKMMRHADVRTTMNIYGTVFDDSMITASGKVAQLAFRANGAQAERNHT